MKQRKRLRAEQFKELLRCFAADIEATKTAQICFLNKNTVNKYYKMFRQEIYKHSFKYYLKNTTCEIDESYFGPRRFRNCDGKLEGKKKIIVFGIIERGGCAYTQIVPNIKTRTLFKIIKDHIDKSTIIYSDECSSYNYLKVKKYHHETVTHSKKEFARGIVNTNSIESFWSYCKRRMSKFNGIDKNNGSSSKFMV